MHVAEFGVVNKGVRGPLAEMLRKNQRQRFRQSHPAFMRANRRQGQTTLHQELVDIGRRPLIQLIVRDDARLGSWTGSRRPHPQTMFEGELVIRGHFGIV